MRYKLVDAADSKTQFEDRQFQGTNWLNFWKNHLNQHKKTN